MKLFQDTGKSHNTYRFHRTDGNRSTQTSFVDDTFPGRLGQFYYLFGIGQQ